MDEKIECLYSRKKSADLKILQSYLNNPPALKIKKDLTEIKNIDFWFFIENERPSSFEVYFEKSEGFFNRQSRKHPALKKSIYIWLKRNFRQESILSYINLILSLKGSAIIAIFCSNFKEYRKSLSTIYHFNDYVGRAGNSKLYLFPPLTKTLNNHDHTKRLKGLFKNLS